MLITRSPVFCAMFTGPAKDESPEIKIEDVDRDAFIEMLRFVTGRFWLKLEKSLRQNGLRSQLNCSNFLTRCENHSFCKVPQKFHEPIKSQRKSESQWSTVTEAVRCGFIPILIHTKPVAKVLPVPTGSLNFN